MGESGDKMTTVEGAVKSERLSPGSSGPGGESGSSRSGTPSSSCTPPRGSPARAYSDFMRSLAAKYNTSAEYPSLRNGLNSTSKTATPFLMPGKEEVIPGFGPFPPPLFPPPSVIDMNATQALLSMVRSHQQGTQLDSYLKSNKREATNAPLDLSATAPPPSKRPRKTLSESLYGSDAVLPLLRGIRPKRPSPRKKCTSACVEKPCAPDSQSVSHWTVEDVAAFVASLDMCAEYAPNFREQRIDGSSLPLLTEDHLTTRLGMRLGPALRLRSILSARLGQCPACLHCVHCHQVPDK